MSEPTIDEMLEWLNRFDYTAGTMPKAIRAILELHKRIHSEGYAKVLELQAIREFMDRVEKRVNDGEEFYQNAVVDELISMEKEAE